jgi:hypothetical protein
MLKIVLAGFAALALTGAAFAQERFQSCTGQLIIKDDAVSLDPDPAMKSPWCDAYLGQDANSDLAKSAIAICGLGNTCAIEGYFQGHGVFLLDPHRRNRESLADRTFDLCAEGWFF